MNPTPLHITGAIKDAPDERDFQFVEVARSLPPFDWNAGYDIETELGKLVGNQSFKLTVKDQGASGSCGGQAWSYYMEVIEAVFTKTYEPRSAKFVYAQTFVPGGGSAGRTNSDLVVKQGDSLESLTPSYMNGSPTEAFMEAVNDITAAARADALKNRALAYYNVGTQIDTIAQAVKANYGVIIGLTGANNGTWNSMYPQPPVNGQDFWYHWLYVGKAKMINGIKYLGVLNSWGNATGDKGWQWLSETYVNALVNDANRNVIWSAWTISWNPTPIPPAFRHQFLKDLSYGQISSEVVALQTALHLEGCLPATIPATGNYLTETRKAVKAFQIKYMVTSLAEINGLDGTKVGPATRGQLNRIYYS